MLTVSENAKQRREQIFQANRGGKIEGLKPTNFSFATSLKVGIFV